MVDLSPGFLNYVSENSIIIVKNFNVGDPLISHNHAKINVKYILLAKIERLHKNLKAERHFKRFNFDQNIVVLTLKKTDNGWRILNPLVPHVSKATLLKTIIALSQKGNEHLSDLDWQSKASDAQKRYWQSVNDEKSFLESLPN